MSIAVRITMSSTDDWVAWWPVERIRTQTDWASLLRQHERAFRQVCELHGLSS